MPEPTDWTQRTSSFGTDIIAGVAYGNGVWVAVGASGKLATATDPTGTWTQGTSSFSTDTIRGVAYGNGAWVAVGTSGKLATATDPTGTWTQGTSSFDTTYINGVAYGDGVWVAVGSSGKLATATDLILLYARPIADVATTGWSTAPLWSKVDDDPDAPDGTVVTASVGS